MTPRVVKFCVRVSYINHWDDRLLPYGYGQSHVTQFLNFGALVKSLEWGNIVTCIMAKEIDT